MAAGAQPSPLVIDAIESDAWAQLQRSLPADIRMNLGIHVCEIADAVLLIAGATRELAINRVMGLGLRAPFSERDLDDIIRTYADAGAERFVVQWHPDAAPAVALDWMAARGFTLISRIAKFCRPTSMPVAELQHDSPFHVDEIGPEEAELFAAVVAPSLGVPAGLEAGIRSTLGHPGWRYYFARDNGRPIAGGALYVQGQCAWLGFGATIESHRRRGAQGVLLARRLRDAKADGCRWASADTLVETAERPNQSYRNMRRAGFSTLYERPNYVLDLGAVRETVKSSLNPDTCAILRSPSPAGDQP